MAGKGDHMKGTMDIAEHRETLALFWTLLKFSVITIVITLVLMAAFLT